MILRLFMTMALLTVAVFSAAGRTNYVCIVCGAGPLTQHVWLHSRGPLCDDCEKLPNRCSLCGLPIKDGDGHVKTGDGRFICKFDKADAVLNLDQARELFEKIRGEVVDLYGPRFALKTPAVTVNLFDVDYWSEKGKPNGLHAFGFSTTRPAADGSYTHEVILLSGHTRREMEGVAAHEYTHLWINENRQDHRIEDDTIEAICELTAYKLMAHKGDADMQRRILENPYTNGRIKDLIAVEREGTTDYVLNWVKGGKAETFDMNARMESLPQPAAPAAYIPPPKPLPEGLKFSGVMAFGKQPSAVINGQEFASGAQKIIKLRNQTVRVHCLEIHEDQVKIEANGKPLTLVKGGEKALP